MSQQMIDLLPASVRSQCEAGARTGRIIAAIVTASLMVIVTATQSRYQLDRERQRLEESRVEAEAVMSAERNVAAMMEDLAAVRDVIDVHKRLSLPLEVSEVMATIINILPPSVTLDSIDLNAGQRRPARTARALALGATASSRAIIGELAGFALSDQDIAELVEKLQATAGFDAVRVDFSRTRLVRDVVAREFRLSFRIDLEMPFEVVTAPDPAAEPSENPL